MIGFVHRRGTPSTGFYAEWLAFQARIGGQVARQLGLGWGGSRFIGRGRGLGGGGGSGLGRIGLVVEFGDGFGDVGGGGDEEQGRSGRRGIDHGAEIVLAGVAIHDGKKAAPDVLDDVVLGGVAVILKRGLLAVELAGEALAVLLGFGFLFVRPGVLLLGELPGDFIDLTVDVVDVFLAGVESRFKIGEGLPPFRSAGDGQAEIDDGDLGRGGLRVDGRGDEEASQGNRGAMKDVSWVHSFLRWSEGRPNHRVCLPVYPGGDWERMARKSRSWWARNESESI
jgi:hypothetical protein